MKTQFTTLLVLIIIASTFAQQGVNYKALIKDSGGNIVASQSITIQFQILQGAGMNNVYQETHTPTTDANGIVVVSIGEGTVDSGVFAAINWGADEHFLNVQINTGGGLTDMGTTEFKTVPYALHAANVTGLEALDEGNGNGWRLIGANADNYGNIGENATDLSFSTSASTSRGATESNAVALGYNTTASGIRSTALGNTSFATGNSSTAMGNLTFAPGSASTAMGESTEASGIRSTAMGRITIASGDTSTAMGVATEASGSFSTALGYGSKARSHGETVVGTYNQDYTPIDPVAFDENDRVFVIGNGIITAPSNALTVLKNGTITAPSFDISEITDDKALITKEYVDAYGPSGLEAIDEGNGIGYRIIGRSPNTVGNIGFDGVDLSRSFLSNGNFGPLGNNSITTGIYTTALGNFSMAIGRETSAESENSLAIGRSNIGGGDPLNWVTTDPLFEVGIGLGSSRANALTILKNGSIGVVTATPEAKLHISSGTDTGLGANNGYVVLGETTGANISLDNNEIMAKNNGNAADLNLQIEGGRVLIGGNVGIGTTDPQELLHVDGILRIGTETIEDTGTNLLAFDANLLPSVDSGLDLGTPGVRWRTVYATNGTINTSDRREKKNINELSYGLAEVLQMQPVSFNWKSKNDPDLKLGLIAQNLQTLIPEVVKSHIWEKDEVTNQLSKKELERLGVYYSDLVPVLIKAIQEQQEIIDSQQADLVKKGLEVSEIKEDLKILKELMLLKVTTEFSSATIEE